ncbi:isochorismatase family cysteine hydrolase [Corynebacterium gerontici]|uniref:Isochorismatase family protein n=1 Tax=Corynebacterium gerontici TaxID=2079234 RepID=A0A3G6J111_9CORY|nr:isochorismatase family cysteine hydrolase [Corynebacterium gerontici]AZA11657.1 Isochorismatase family protein [Corynebacterium gerontici]
MHRESTALLVVDVQAGFISPYTQRALPRIHELIESDAFDLVIATRFHNPEGSPYRKFIKWDRLSTPEEIALDPKVEQSADVVIDKATYMAGDEIAASLKAFGIAKVLVVGIDTDVCVLQNAAYLFDHGFEVSIDLEGCATNGGAEADAAAVRLLERTIGRDHVLGSQHQTLASTG